MNEIPLESEPLTDIFNDFELKVIEDKAIKQLAAMYRDAYDDVEELTKQLNKAAQKKAALGEQFCSILLENGLDSIKTDEGSFGPKVEQQVSIINQDRAFEIIEEQGEGASIKRKIEWQTLNKIFRDNQEFAQAVRDSDEGVFKTWEKRSIRIRRSND